MKLIFFTLLLANFAFAIYLYRVGPDQRESRLTPAVAEAGGVQLLSERSGTSNREKEVEELLENPVVAERTEPRVTTISCYRIGPFLDITSAQNVSERISAVGHKVTLRAVDTVTGDYDFRVVIPPLPSLQEAFRKLRELKNQDIDSYVMTQGSNAQGISLGVFSTQKAADAHQDWLAGEGYSTEITEIARMSRDYWSYGEPGRTFPHDLVAQAGVDNKAISIEETGCLN